MAVFLLREAELAMMHVLSTEQHNVRAALARVEEKSKRKACLGADRMTQQELLSILFGPRMISVVRRMLALEQLGLDPKRDGITLVPVGSPAQILHALEQGAIDRCPCHSRSKPGT
jgi:hypothetical protein